MTPQPSSRDRVLARVRGALADVSITAENPEIARDYLSSHTPDDPAAILDLLHENLADYRAVVHRTTEDELQALISRLLAEHGAKSVAVPRTCPPPGWPHRTPSNSRTMLPGAR